MEGALPCLLNNLDPDVAEDAGALVVYGGRGRAARSPEALAGFARVGEDARDPRAHRAGADDGHLPRQPHR